ncbi:unnamed protein product [Ectocarpus sp. 13 AM-2016]
MFAVLGKRKVNDVSGSGVKDPRTHIHLSVSASHTYVALCSAGGCWKKSGVVLSTSSGIADKRMSPRLIDRRTSACRHFFSLSLAVRSGDTLESSRTPERTVCGSGYRGGDRQSGEIHPTS